MRKDLAQLLVEHPRHNAGELYREHRRIANRNPEDAPRKQGMRKPYRERKEFGEYFAPIMGLLRVNVGRPWDKVFSELNKALSGGGTVVEHVRQHVLDDFVTLKPGWHDGVACYPPHRYGAWRDKPIPITRTRNDGFYVDQQGILRQGPLVPRRRYKKDKPSGIKIDAHTAYHKIDGDWFRVWTKPLEAASMGSTPLYDIVLKRWIRCRGAKTFFRPEMAYAWYVEGTSGLWELERLHGSARIAYRKEQISNRTIRREKLNERLG